MPAMRRGKHKHIERCVSRILIPLVLPLFAMLVSWKMNKSSASPPDVSPPAPIAAPASAQPAAQVEVAQVRPNREPPTLAFGQHLLGQLTEDVVVLWDVKRCAKVKKIPAKTPWGIGALADGSLLFVEMSGSAKVKVTHLEKGGVRKTFPAILRRSEQDRFRMLANPKDASAFWILTPERNPSLYAAQLALLVGSLKFTDILHPPSAANDSLIALPDGELLFVEGRQLKSPSDGGRALTLPPEVGFPIHLAPGGDKDHLYAATWEGALHRLELGKSDVRSTMRIAMGAKVYALDGAAGRVAALLVEDPLPWTLRFSLVVFGTDGSELLRQELKWLPSRLPVEPISIRLSAEGHVAVGDGRRLAVWDVATKKVCISDGIVTK